MTTPPKDSAQSREWTGTDISIADQLSGGPSPTDIAITDKLVTSINGFEEVANAQYASLDGLAPGSRAAQERQRETAEKLRLPIEICSMVTGIRFRLIPAGTFMMGSPENEKGRSHDEGPQHQVTISQPFYMGTFQLTQAQWQKVMSNNPSNFIGDDLPVEQVSWNDCQEYMRKLEKLEGLTEGSMRLPTEAEWEYACRAWTKTTFCYGDDLDSSMANFDGNYPYGNGSIGKYRARTMPVGSFKPNAWGLYDMHGNVWEWCQDRWASYSSGSVTDPRGPANGSHRVIRGGGWGGYAWHCRSASRYNSFPVHASSGGGFRLSLPAGQ